MDKFANDRKRIELHIYIKALKTKLSFKWLGKSQWCRECFVHIFQWFKTCWCLKEIFRAILCLEGVLFYFSFHTASIWNKSPWVCYILKTLWKTFIGPDLPDHITLAAQHILTRIKEGHCWGDESCFRCGFWHWSSRKEEYLNELAIPLAFPGYLSSVPSQEVAVRLKRNWCCWCLLADNLTMFKRVERDKGNSSHTISKQTNTKLILVFLHKVNLHWIPKILSPNPFLDKNKYNWNHS